ncbi:MAG: glycine zipper 2TM domain-containing protein [Oceanospirillales bacterium]|nr:glycine zipper 2TM domain-containing protein [Oceanospirillales bacterium]
MNSKVLIAGLTLLSALGSSLVAEASPFDPRPQQGIELSHYKHHDRYPAHDRRERLARVLDVKPIWPKHDRYSKHDRYCRDDRRYSDRDDRRDRGDRDEARIVGALAGGVVGNMIGREHDNALVGTVAGALIGSAGADIIVSQGRISHRGKECVSRHKLKYHQQPVAYRVRYIYRGQVYTTRTREHPGRYIEIDHYYDRRG